MDMDFRESFQKALLDNNAIIAKATEVMEEHEKATHDLNIQVKILTHIIGEDENKGMQKVVCKLVKDVNGDGKEPGLWTVVGRIAWVVGGISTIGGIMLVSYLTEHPNALVNLMIKLSGG